VKIELDDVDFKVLISLLDHAAELCDGRRGYDFVQHAGLTEEQRQELERRMTAFLEKEEADPYHPDHDWHLHYTRLEWLLKDEARREP
jgi:hypothetical protein